MGWNHQPDILLQQTESTSLYPARFLLGTKPLKDFRRGRNLNCNNLEKLWKNRGEEQRNKLLKWFYLLGIHEFSATICLFLGGGAFVSWRFFFFMTLLCCCNLQFPGTKTKDVEGWSLKSPNTLQTKRKSHLKMDGLKLEDELPFGMAYFLGPYFFKGVYMFLFFGLSFHPTFFCGPKIHNGRWYTWATPTKILTWHSELYNPNYTGCLIGILIILILMA